MEPVGGSVEEESLDGRRTGRFTGRTEGLVEVGKRVELDRVARLDVDAAISWARERAGLVLVRSGRHSPDGFTCRVTTRPADLSEPDP